MVHAQGFELPIGAGNHVDCAIAVHQDGKVAIFRSSSSGGAKDLFGVCQEFAHEVLIASGGRDLSCGFLDTGSFLSERKSSDGRREFQGADIYL